MPQSRFECSEREISCIETVGGRCFADIEWYFPFLSAKLAGLK